MNNTETNKQHDDGFLLIDKPHGWTSRQVVDVIEKKFPGAKVGHTGSLDPFATGLLVITVGKATKAGAFIEALPKTYQATLKLGTQTDSGDVTGKPIATSEIYPLFDNYVQEALEMFLGDSIQTPPMHSALKVDGKPLYKLAHQGITIEREPRPIHVFEIKLDQLEEGLITFTATVSKGTYMRTLGEDIAKKLGMVGHLTKLTRLSVGGFHLKDHISLDNVKSTDLKPVIEGLSFMTIIMVDERIAKDVMDGKPQLFKSGEQQVLVVHKNAAIAVYERREAGIYYSLRGLF